jgi:hypothetical protein
MENQKNSRKAPEDQIGANAGNKSKLSENKVDAFKTGDKKQGRYFDQPFDEQMHDSDSLSDNSQNE